MEAKDLYKQLEEMYILKNFKKMEEVIFLYTLHRTNYLIKKGIPRKKAKKIAENEVNPAIKEIFGGDLPYESSHSNKIRGVGCSGDYPYSPRDFLTVMSWRREEYECQPEYEEFFEEE